MGLRPSSFNVDMAFFKTETHVYISDYSTIACNSVGRTPLYDYLGVTLCMLMSTHSDSVQRVCYGNYAKRITVETCCGHY